MSFKQYVRAGGISTFLLFSGCQQSPISPDSLNNSTTLQSEQLVLGKKLENPYSVHSMLRAKDSLVTRGALSKNALSEEDFKATHYYLRFKPQSDTQLVKLKSDPNLVLWDYPLDFEIIEGGTVYRDPEIPAGYPNYQYTAVAVNHKLPDVEFEILEKLLLEAEPEDSILSKRKVSSYYTILEQEALRITGNLSKKGDGLSKRTEKWIPSGNILVTDNVLNRNTPIVQVNVRVRNWFKWWDGYTDENGNFVSPKEYNGDVAYSLRWQYPDNKFDIRSGTTGQAFYNGPNQQQSAWNLVISSDMSWVYAHIFRAGRFYIAEETWNLGAPFNHISIGAYDEDDRAYYIYPPLWFPDIRVYRYSQGSTKDAAGIFRTTCHELAHAHHREIRGNVNWNYGIDDKIQEGWAVGVAQFMEDAVYSKRSFWQDVSFTWIKDMNHGGEKKYTPIVIDMIDNFNQRNRYGSDYPIDRVSGYTLEQIQNTLIDTETWDTWRNKIKAISNPTNSFVDELFKQYDNL